MQSARETRINRASRFGCGAFQLLVMVGLFGVLLAHAAPINYQGRLDADGEPFNGSANLSFHLFQSESGGSPIAGPITLSSWPVVNGLFQVELDFGPNAFSGGQAGGDERYLEIVVDGLTLAPRQRVTAAPIAITTLPGAIGLNQIDPAQVQRRIGSSCPQGQYIRAVSQNGTVTCGSDADAGGTVTSIATGAGLTGGPITATGTIAIAPGGVGAAQINSGQVQRRVVGSCPVGQYMRRVDEDGGVVCEAKDPVMPAWLLGGNSGSDSSTHFLGTIDNEALEIRTGNARSLRIEPSIELFEGLPVSAQVIAGSRANIVRADAIGAVIAGGGTPAGYQNPDISLTGPNLAYSIFGAIGGGLDNQVGRGQDSAIYPFATVGGGHGNSAFAEISTISGGRFNFVYDTAGSVGGGNGNRAYGVGAVIAGGVNNRTDASSGSIGGGSRNAVAGVNAVVSGGWRNCAGGHYSWAGGRRAKVRPSDSATAAGGCQAVPTGGSVGDEGTFIWADSEDQDFVSSGPNQFLVRASGGVGFGRTPSDYFVIDSGRELQDADYSFGTGALRVLMQDAGNTVTMFRILGNGGVAVGNSFNSSGVPERGMKIQGRLALQSLGTGGSTTLCRNGDNEVATCSSSARYKSDIEDLQDPMSLIAALRPVRYQWLDGSGEDIGLVAEEVAAAVPELAMYMAGQVEGVKYDRLGVLLLAVVQQQSEQIAELRRRIEQAEATAERNPELESRLAALEALLLGDQALAGAQ